MLNGTLFRREMQASIKLLVILGAVITMYVACIIGMYDPETMVLLDTFTETMPEIMAAVGMTAGATDLLGFMISYLYGFILLIFPMLYSILRSNGLIAKYVDQGSMVYLVAAPRSRRTVAMTQTMVLLSGVFLLHLYVTVLQAAVSQLLFPGELVISDLLLLNLGLLFLQICISSICFLSSCIFSETKYSALIGAGLPTLMYLFQMIGNVSEKAEVIKSFTIFTLFDPNGLAAGEGEAFLKCMILLVTGLVLYPIGITVFCKKDLHI